MRIKPILAILACLIPGLSACETGSGNQHIEKQIRSEVMRESSGIASLQALYTLTFVHFEENLITSDDFYIQKHYCPVKQ